MPANPLVLLRTNEIKRSPRRIGEILIQGGIASQIVYINCQDFKHTYLEEKFSVGSLIASEYVHSLLIRKENLHWLQDLQRKQKQNTNVQ